MRAVNIGLSASLGGHILILSLIWFGWPHIFAKHDLVDNYEQLALEQVESSLDIKHLTVHSASFNPTYSGAENIGDSVYESQISQILLDIIEKEQPNIASLIHNNSVTMIVSISSGGNLVGYKIHLMHKNNKLFNTFNEILNNLHILNQRIFPENSSISEVKPYKITIF